MRMVKITTLLKTCCLLLILLLMGCKQENQSGDFDSIELDQRRKETGKSLEKLKNIEDIKNQYRYIVDLYEKKALDSSSFTYNCYDEKSGKVTFFSNKEGLKMIEHSYNEYSHYSATHRYYIQKDKPFFIYYNDLAWQFDGEKNGKSATKDNFTEKRYYILENRIIECLAKQYTISSATDTNPVPDKIPNKKVPCPSINKLAESYVQLLRYRNQTSTLKCLE